MKKEVETQRCLNCHLEAIGLLMRCQLKQDHEKRKESEMELLYFEGIEVAYNKLVSKCNNSVTAYKAFLTTHKEMEENDN